VSSHDPPAFRGPVLVCGLNPLGIAVIRQLVAKGETARALASADDLASYSHELKRLGVPACVGIASSAGELEAAGLHDASAVILTANDDAENVDAALTARRLRAGIPIVARVFDPSLGQYLEETEAGLRVMSVSGLASPRFADLAIRAANEAGAERAAAPDAAAPRAPRAAPRRVDPILVRLGFVVAAVTALSVWFFGRALGVSGFDALYFVVETITTTGYGDFAVRESGPWAKLVAILLMIGGAGVLAIVYALVTEWFIARRLDVLQGRRPERGRDHVVVAGAGNVGFRVAQLLAAAGRRVVVIERQPDSRNAFALRAEGHHVIVADAGLDESLDLAGVDRASVVLALTDSDAVNLTVALAVRGRGLDVPVVIRLISPELSDHLHGRKGIVTVSPIAVASEAFALAALALRRTVSGGGL
jgi:Trk K+ transport system NAD-binding subunit